MKLSRRHLLTASVVLVAAIVVLAKYWAFVTNPWTRDGKVRAEIIQVAPRVSGPIVELPIRDNQFVNAGDLLFRIDPRTYEAALDKARAEVDQTSDSVRALEQQVKAARAAVEISRADIERARRKLAQLDATLAKYQAEYERQQELLPQKATSAKAVEAARASYEVSVEERRSQEAALGQSQAALLKSQAALAETEAKLGAIGESNPQLRGALAALRQAELNLEFTSVRAETDGYVTNLNLRLGSQAVANQPALAFIDAGSFWVNGYFRETTIGDIAPGDEALVILMTFPDAPIEGRVDSIGWGIAQQDGSTGFELLPTVSPTFEWIRLAQRIPVKIALPEMLPDGVTLRVGTTASVLVRTGTADGS